MSGTGCNQCVAKHRDKINPELPLIKGETPEALQMRKVEAREADTSLRHLHFLFEERAPAFVRDAVTRSF